MEDAFRYELRNMGKDRASCTQISGMQSTNSECRFPDDKIFQILHDQKSLAEEAIKVKHKIKTEIVDLIGLLKKRELELCFEVDEIYHYWNSYSLNQLAKMDAIKYNWEDYGTISRFKCIDDEFQNNELNTIGCRNKTYFISSFDELKNLIKVYGTVGTFENKSRSSLDLNDMHVTNKNVSNLNLSQEIWSFEKRDVEVNSHCIPGERERNHDLKEEYISMKGFNENSKEKSSTESLDSFEILDSKDLKMDRRKLPLQSYFTFGEPHNMESLYHNLNGQSSEVSSWLSNTTEMKKLKMTSIISPIVPNIETDSQSEPSSQLKKQLNMLITNNEFLNTFSNAKVSHLIASNVKDTYLDSKNSLKKNQSFQNDTSFNSDWLQKKKPDHVKCISEQLKLAPSLQMPTYTVPSDFIKQSFSSFFRKENKDKWLCSNPEMH